ncbi:MAG: hypothetical protein AAF567_21100 [Actinomycetota bacterium]
MIRIPTERQGQTGMGQGGYGCWLLAQQIDQPVTTALRSKLPLETELRVDQVVDDRWQLVDPTDDDRVLLEAASWAPDCPETAPVSVDEAEAARRLARIDLADHPAPHCVSCGLDEGSLRVHAGPLGDGRWATPLRLPVTADGGVDDSLLWMAVDCACGWYTSGTGDQGGRGVTVQFAVEQVAPIEPEVDYVLVAWNGDFVPDWDGRKRGAAAALFTADGSVVARSRSFWLRPAS